MIALEKNIPQESAMLISLLPRPAIMDTIKKLYLYRLIASFTFIAPIFVLFLQDNGLSMTHIMTLQAIYTLTMLSFSIVSGSLADRISRKAILVLGSIMQLLGYGLYSISSSFMQFVGVEILLGISIAMWDSSYSAFIYDTLKEQKRTKDYKRVFGNVFALLFLGMGISAPIGSFLASYDLRLPFYMSIIPSALAVFIAIGFREPKYKKKEMPYLGHLSSTIKYCWNKKRIRYLILLGSITYSVLFAAFFTYQPYFQAAGLPIAYFGFVYLLLEISTAAGARYAGWLEGILKEELYLLIITAMPMFGLLIMAYNPIIGIGITLLLGFASGMLEPALTDYLNSCTESYHRATVISVYGTFFGLLSSLMLIAIGYSIDNAGLSVSLLGLAGIASLNLLVLLALRKERC